MRIYRSLSSYKSYYDPQSIDKSVLKWISLIRASILGQPPDMY